ncbi:MAG: ABC transporter ATP-binding protein/permease [Lachnospiraceae bacterium]|nr:ABC transporter ATP-binding protein/permease [Lachnospiraceae bacterium]
MPPASQRNTKKERPKDAKGTMKRIWKYIIRYRAYVIIIAILCISSNILSLIGPSLAGKAIQEAAAGKGQVNFANVFYYAKLMLIFYITASALTLLINILMMNVGRRIARQLRTDVFNKMMKLKVSYFDTNAAGDIISRVSYDIDVLSTSISTDLVSIMTNVITVFGSLFMMIYISPLLALTVLVTIPLSVVYIRFMGRKTRPLHAKRSAAYGKLNGFVEEMFSGQKTIQSYAQEDPVTEKFETINTEASDAFHWANHYGMTMGPTLGSINNLGLALIGMFGSVLYLKDLVNLAQISSFVLYSRKFSGPINEIANIVNEIYSALAASERVFYMLDAEEEPADTENALELTDIEGNVAIKDVNFGYVPEKLILHDFTLDAPAGKLVAIVGPTGAGKTTVINLLMRFYDVNSGEITVDGHEIRTLTRKSLRHSFSMVLQDTWLINGTIFENIAYGKEGATRDEVVAAAKAARIHHFIMQLPEGYDTVISEDGGNISKGQKQMLTIARAMLYDSKMLILDEATSNVDTDTERQIQSAMRQLMADKTCFVIAHRLSTIQNADKIIVVNDGRIIEHGTHSQLMGMKGFYHKLYASQFE